MRGYSDTPDIVRLDERTIPDPEFDAAQVGRSRLASHQHDTLDSYIPQPTRRCDEC